MKLLEPAEEAGSIAGFLGKAVEPPVGPAVDHAITLLRVSSTCCPCAVQSASRIGLAMYISQVSMPKPLHNVPFDVNLPPQV